jgi:hypothetical protein
MTDAAEPSEEELAEEAIAVLADVELTPRSHFEVSLHAAVFALVGHLLTLDAPTDLRRLVRRYAFLAAYLDAAVPFVPPGLAWDEGDAWWINAIGGWEGPRHAELALARLETALDLPPVARTHMLLAGLVEEDSRFGKVWADLNGGIARRPTFETLTSVGQRIDLVDSAATLIELAETGILAVTGEDGPRSQWVLAPAREIWDQMRGDGHTPRGHRPVDDLPDLDDLILDQQARERARRVAERWDDLDLLVIRGSRGSDRVALAGAIARAAGHGTVAVTTPSAEGACVLAVMLAAAPVIELDLPPGETVVVPRPPGLAGPVIAVLGATGGIDRRGHERAVSIDLPLLDASLRAARWRAALGDAPVEDVEGIAAACRVQGAHIDRIATAAVAVAAVERGQTLRLEHVQAAARELQRQLLDTQATRLDVAGSWADVVVGDFTADKLDELEARCRYRDRLGASLAEAYGLGTGVGVRALFTGASGTGKTLAARVLGARLGLDVYRVDLAAIVNKYVGETEKNLHRLLSMAEELDVVLLIDEGDSLLGRRTELRSSNDRFANLETNYLLQLLEHHRGIVVATTNAADHIDPAFHRRMDVVVTFQPPTPLERAEIWRLHLPADHVVPADHLADLATRCTMTGGQIRNAVLHAVLLALEEDRPVAARHVERAVASEYRKAGASSPYDPSGRRESLSRARAFQQVIG